MSPGGGDGSATFPAPVYRDTVLAPLFEGAKQHHFRQLMRVQRASAIMLAARGLLTRDEAAALLRALQAIETETDLPALRYTGQHEDLFFVVEARTRAIPVIPLRLLRGRLPLLIQFSNICVGLSAYAVSLRTWPLAATADERLLGPPSTFSTSPSSFRLYYLTPRQPPAPG